MKLPEQPVKLFSIRAFSTRAFTLVEIMIAISILAIILAAIFSSWTAILRSKKVAIDSTASIQRARISLRIIEDSLTYLRDRSFATTGITASFGSGVGWVTQFCRTPGKILPAQRQVWRFGCAAIDLLNRVGSGSSSQLVLRQSPIMTDPDKDEAENPLVLAKDIKGFEMQFWDQKLNDWTDEWKDTNALPKLVMVP